MADEGDRYVLELPTEMLQFSLRHLENKTIPPRLGRLLSHTQNINTPNYVIPTSRGIVPHLTPDTMHRHCNVSAAYVALEDCTCHFPSAHPALALTWFDSQNTG